ncbi:von Willebrand factor A domain-containing protein 2 [Manis javanica]|nr:von Willebrand factor A domain-containing protein 2 [Manis javanica]
MMAAVIPAALKLSLECRADILFLLASSAGTTLEGFLRAKAFMKRFVQAVLSEDSHACVGVAWYSRDLVVAVPVGKYQDVPGLVRSLDGISFSRGATLTGSALQQAAERGFGSTARTGQDHPRRVVVLLTESRSQDKVASLAHHAARLSLDLIFMLDTSASVGSGNFAQMQSFLRSCALQFDLNTDGTQMGLVV